MVTCRSPGERISTVWPLGRLPTGCFSCSYSYLCFFLFSSSTNNRDISFRFLIPFHESKIGTRNRQRTNLRSYGNNEGRRRHRMGRSAFVTATGRQWVVLLRAAMLTSSSWRHQILGLGISASNSRVWEGEKSGGCVVVSHLHGKAGHHDLFSPTQ